MWRNIFLACIVIITFILFHQYVFISVSVVHPVVAENVHPVRVAKPQQRRIVFSLTSSPKRIVKIEPTILSLLQQSVPADMIQLNLPRIFTRNNETFPKNLTVQYPILLNPKIRIVWSDDLGPVTKLVPTLHTETNPATLIIIVDDDTIYPINMLAMMKERLDTDPNFIQTNQCGDEHALTNKEEEFNNTAPFNLTQPSNKYKSHCCCRLHLGYGGVGYRRGLFNNPQLPFDRYLSIAMSNPYCFRGDDFVVSNYLTLMGYQGLALRLKVTQQQYGFEPDALHKLQPRWYDEGIERYSNCSQFLQRKNLSILRTPYDQL